MDKEFAYSFLGHPSYGNKWMDLNPLSKLTICLCIGLSTVFAMDWRYGLTMCLLYILFAPFSGKGKQFLKLFALVGISVAVLTILIRQVGHRDINETVMFTLFGWTWYLESFLQALTVVSYIDGFAGAMLIYFTTTEMRDLMYAFERKGVSHETSYIMLSSMQSIIDMKKSAETIMESQKSRGIETEGNILTRMKAFFPTLGPILLSAMANTEEKAIAMDARAFSVECEHSFLRELKPVKTGEKLIVAAAILVMVLTIVYQILHVAGVL